MLADFFVPVPLNERVPISQGSGSALIVDGDEKVMDPSAPPNESEAESKANGLRTDEDSGSDSIVLYGGSCVKGELLEPFDVSHRIPLLEFNGGVEADLSLNGEAD